MPSTSNSLIYPQGIRTASCVCTAAKTTYGDGANAVLLATAGPNGSLVRSLGAVARATVSVTQLQIYKYDGTNYWLQPTQVVNGSMSSSTIAPVADFLLTDSKTMYLPSGWSLYAAVAAAVSSGVVFNAELGDF